MKNFDLAPTGVILSINGPRTLLNRKAMPYKKKVNPEMTFLDLFKEETRINFTAEVANQYHIILNRHVTGAGGGFKFALSGTVKEFIEMNYKRPSTSYYSIRIARKRTPGPGGRGAAAQLVDLEVETILESSRNDATGSQRIEAIKNDIGEAESPVADLASSPEQNLHQSAVDEHGGTSSPQQEAAATETFPSSSRSESDGQAPGSSTSTNQSSAGSIKGEAMDGKKTFFKFEGTESTILDLRAQGIQYKNAVPAVKKNLRRISNEMLLRVGEEIRRLKNTKRHPYAEIQWENLCSKAPLSCRLLERLFLTNADGQL